MKIPNSDQCVGENTLNVILQPTVFHAILPLPVHVKYIAMQNTYQKSANG